MNISLIERFHGYLLDCAWHFRKHARETILITVIASVIFTVIQFIARPDLIWMTKLLTVLAFAIAYLLGRFLADGINGRRDASDLRLVHLPRTRFAPRAFRFHPDTMPKHARFDSSLYSDPFMFDPNEGDYGHPVVRNGEFPVIEVQHVDYGTITIHNLSPKEIARVRLIMSRTHVRFRTTSERKHA